MKISIIIPAYNVEKIIQKSVQSVCTQTYQNWECLVMDGGSTDNTLQLLDNIGDERLKVFSEKDKGIYDAMNKGVGLSTGQWLYFMGADDALYDSEVLSDVVAALQQHHSASVIYGKVMTVDANNHFSEKGKKYDETSFIKEVLCHQAVFYKKTVFEKFGLYSLKYKAKGDQAFNLKWFYSPEVSSVYINRIIAKYYTQGYSSIEHDLLFEKEIYHLLQKYARSTLSQKQIKALGFYKYQQYIYQMLSEGPMLKGGYELLRLFFITDDVNLLKHGLLLIMRRLGLR